mmetsp:Transcript_11965/g.28002  ORF Transcript_11965/g.28002 Transcript_11965/m.28002 type:complete len:203 (-) Transcript_11965:2152-2760(-)
MAARRPEERRKPLCTGRGTGSPDVNAEMATGDPVVGIGDGPGVVTEDETATEETEGETGIAAEIGETERMKTSTPTARSIADTMERGMAIPRRPRSRQGPKPTEMRQKSQMTKRRQVSKRCWRPSGSWLQMMPAVMIKQGPKQTKMGLPRRQPRRKHHKRMRRPSRTMAEAVKRRRRLQKSLRRQLRHRKRIPRQMRTPSRP